MTQYFYGMNQVDLARRLRDSGIRCLQSGSSGVSVSLAFQCNSFPSAPISSVQPTIVEYTVHSWPVAWPWEYKDQRNELMALKRLTAQVGNRPHSVLVLTPSEFVSTCRWSVSYSPPRRTCPASADSPVAATLRFWLQLQTPSLIHCLILSIADRHSITP